MSAGDSTRQRSLARGQRGAKEHPLCLISTILGSIGCVVAIVAIIISAVAVSTCYGYYC